MSKLLAKIKSYDQEDWRIIKMQILLVIMTVASAATLMLGTKPSQ